jgi:hypothetical protein
MQKHLQLVEKISTDERQELQALRAEVARLRALVAEDDGK